MDAFKGITQARYNKWAIVQRHGYRRGRTLAQRLYRAAVQPNG